MQRALTDEVSALFAPFFGKKAFRLKPNRSLYVLLVLLFAIFLCYGIYFNIFGTNATLCMQYLQIQETSQGLILTAQSLACLIVAIYLACYGEKHNKLNGIKLGFSIMLGASLLIGILPLLFAQGEGYVWMLSLSAIGGVGFITIDLLMNGVIADVFPEKKNTYLPYVHAFYGVGAMLAPLFVMGIVNIDSAQTFTKPYAILGLIGLPILALLWFVGRKVMPLTPYMKQKISNNVQSASHPAEVFKSPTAWLLLIGSTLYLCFQNGLSAWLPNYCTQYLQYDYTVGASILSLYFMGALVMRFSSPWFYRFIEVKTFYWITLALSVIVFGIAFIAKPPMILFIVLVGIGGFLQGSSIPSLVILCCDAFPTRSASASAIVVLSVSISAFVSPLVMGWMIEQFSYSLPMVVITICVALSAWVIHLAVKNGKTKATS